MKITIKCEAVNKYAKEIVALNKAISNKDKIKLICEDGNLYINVENVLMDELYSLRFKDVLKENVFGYKDISGREYKEWIENNKKELKRLFQSNVELEFELFEDADYDMFRQYGGTVGKEYTTKLYENNYDKIETRQPFTKEVSGMFVEVRKLLPTLYDSVDFVQKYKQGQGVCAINDTLLRFKNKECHIIASDGKHLLMKKMKLNDENSWDTDVNVLLSEKAIKFLDASNRKVLQYANKIGSKYKHQYNDRWETSNQYYAEYKFCNEGDDSVLFTIRACDRNKYPDVDSILEFNRDKEYHIPLYDIDMVTKWLRNYKKEDYNDKTLLIKKEGNEMVVSTTNYWLNYRLNESKKMASFTYPDIDKLPDNFAIRLVLTQVKHIFSYLEKHSLNSIKLECVWNPELSYMKPVYIHPNEYTRFLIMPLEISNGATFSYTM